MERPISRKNNGHCPGLTNRVDRGAGQKGDRLEDSLGIVHRGQFKRDPSLENKSRRIVLLAVDFDWQRS